MIKRVEPSTEGRLGEGRLRRWSRLKQESRTEKEQSPPVLDPQKAVDPAPAAHSAPAPASEAEKEDDPMKDLPSLESLTKDSDYSAFMREGVPEDVRGQALQKLWASEPAFREPFAFEMHMEDYNATFTPIDALKDTIYKVGRGFLTQEDIDAQSGEDKEKKKSAEAETAAVKDVEMVAGKPADAAAEGGPDPVVIPDAESQQGVAPFPETKEGQTLAVSQGVVDKSDKFPR